MELIDGAISWFVVYYRNREPATTNMNKSRLEAFSDGVIAVIITIMVLELKVPHGEGLAALVPLLPVLASYVLSFVYVGIYWNNHHHMLHAVKHVNGKALWANLHLLFWLSLIPFATGWVNENHFAPVPVAVYGAVLLMAGVAYYLLSQILIRSHEADSPLARAVGRDIKGILSVVIYVIAILLTCFNEWVSMAMYVGVAMMWFIPDRRIEKVLEA